MELDLDAFLQSQDTTGSDDDDQQHRSTVDELLLIDSDDSSSPRSYSYLSPQSNTNPVDVGSSDPPRLIPSQSKFRSISPGDTFSLSRQLPSLFGAVRSNAKPGAALAAAAAASRLIPTPHAAAIKLRREKSSTEILDPKASIGSEISYESSEISHSDAKLVEEELKLDKLETENFQLNAEYGSRNGWRITDQDFPCEDVDNTSKVDSFEQFFSEDTCSCVDLNNEGRILNKEGTIDEGIDTLQSIGEVYVDAKEVEDSVSEGTKLHEKETEGDADEILHQGSEKNDERTLKPLEFAEEVEKKHAFTGLHWEEGAAAQPMKLEGGSTSTVLGYFSISSDNTITRTISSPAFRRDHGTPQALAVHINYIAVGMSRGVIIVVPSKYSPHYADNMEAKMLMLGLQGDRSYAPVTSMSFNQQGDLLFAGYADGHYTVWDVQRVSAAKLVTEHKAPVVHMLYLGMDSQVTRQFNIVSGDSKGVVKLIRFSPFSWLNRFSTSKTSTLLDESTSTVVCASPLLSEESSGSIPTFAEEGVVIFVTHQSALVAKVISNTPEVYAQLPKPDGVREGSMPYTAWKYMAPSHAENVQSKESETAPLLAIAWDHIVQVAKLVKSELKICAKWRLESSAIGVAWLDDQMLIVLTSAGRLCLYANDGTLIHDTNFAVDGGRGDDVIGHHTHFSNEKAHHNCIGVRGASLYLLGPTHLVVSRLLPWKERVQVLRKGGDWMGAFNMAMMLYDGQAHGVFDLPRALENVQKTIMPYMVELLLAYVDEVFSYISVAVKEKMEQLNDSGVSVNSEIKEQYTRVGGVAVEFCVHINRTDILFDQILSRFQSVQQKETFLELLEPYILKDMLGSLPPEIMQALVEHYSTKGWLQRVEQCVLHMDISSLDFNQVVRLCQEHNLYGALIYLFNKGLDDFRTPLEELLRVFRNNNSENAPSLGYRMLVYLKYCFSGLAFPPGHGSLPPARLPSLRMELIHLLLEDSNAPSSWGLTCLSSTKAYKNLYHLLELDTEATLDVLKCAFIDSRSQCQDLIQNTVDVLAIVLETSKTQPEIIWPSKDDIGRILDFISHFVACGEAKISKEILTQTFEYLTLDNIESKSLDFLKNREKQVLALLEVVPETDWDDGYLFDMCEKAQFYQVCGFIHDSKQQYISAIDSLMKDVDEPVHAFSYISNLLQNSDKRPDSLEAQVISRIPNLVQLCREGTVFLVVQHLFQEFQQILVELKSHPKSLFLYLKTVIEAHSKGTLNFSSLRVKNQNQNQNQNDRLHDFLQRISDFPKFLRDNPLHITDEITEMYLELLCEYEPKSVLHFLETCESYRVDHCLRLCQEHGIIDAAAFLLERVGDVGSALSFTLSDLMDKFHMLDAVVQSVHDFNAVMKKKEVNDILYIVYTCVGLCQRNSSRLDPIESEALWFQLLDTFCEPLTNPGVDKMDSENKWKIKGCDEGAHILRKLLSVFIKEIVEGMIGYVRLPTVMMKLLSDNGHQEFGDFKATILGMLGTYDFEKRILDTAKSLIEDDTYYTMRLLKKGASHGHGPQSLVCCICNCLLTKDTSASGIRVYSCGHASHLHCVPPGTRRGGGGCPICMSKKKGIRATTNHEDGLVSTPFSKNKSTQGTAGVHSHETDPLDRQISRYEILSNLDKEKRVMVQVDNMPQLRLAPPAVYHEKVKNMLRGESSDKTKQSKDLKKTKGSGVRFPLKSNIFGKEKTSRR